MNIDNVFAFCFGCTFHTRKNPRKAHEIVVLNWLPSDSVLCSSLPSVSRTSLNDHHLWSWFTNNNQSILAEPRSPIVTEHKPHVAYAKAWHTGSLHSLVVRRHLTVLIQSLVATQDQFVVHTNCTANSFWSAQPKPLVTFGAEQLNSSQANHWTQLHTTAH